MEHSTPSNCPALHGVLPPFQAYGREIRLSADRIGSSSFWAVDIVHEYSGAEQRLRVFGSS